MSKIFYDRLLNLDKIDKEIKKAAKSKEEREELWVLVDEIIHHKVVGCILDNLPREKHEQFLDIFYKNPHDEELLFSYLRQEIGENVEDIIKQEIDNLSLELLQDIQTSKNG
jgi:hypothetical protein